VPKHGSRMVNAWQNRASAQCELKPWNLCRSCFSRCGN
jgi:hypothetical protein